MEDTIDTISYEQKAIGELTNMGFRKTNTRRQVVRALAQATTVLSAYDIHKAIKEADGMIDVVSVYRTLQTLQDCGLVYKLSNLDGYIRREIGSGVIEWSRDGTAREVAPTDVDADYLIAIADRGYLSNRIEREVA